MNTTHAPFGGRVSVRKGAGGGAGAEGGAQRIEEGGGEGDTNTSRAPFGRRVRVPGSAGREGARRRGRRGEGKGNTNTSHAPFGGRVRVPGRARERGRGSEEAQAQREECEGGGEGRQGHISRSIWWESESAREGGGRVGWIYEHISYSIWQECESARGREAA